MRKIDEIFLVFFALLVFLASFIGIPLSSPVEPDGISLKTDSDDTKTDVSESKVLFIGDSHTAFKYGWQYRLAKKTGMSQTNISVSGKTTAWMLSRARSAVKPDYDFCFIYGGANDAYNGISPAKIVANLTKMIEICEKNGVIPILVLGFDPETCVTNSRAIATGYPKRYKEAQRLMKNMGVSYVEFSSVSLKECADGFCHMTTAGHEKASEDVISQLNFKKAGVTSVQKSRP